MSDKKEIKDQLKRPIRDLRISVTDRCNFRCSYCMPAEIYGDRYKFLEQDKLLTFEEITRVTNIAVKLGVEKVRITGGEPLVRKNIDILVRLISEIHNLSDIAMTTNGYLLPKLAHTLKNAGLKRLTVSLDTLNDDIFRQMNGRNFGVKSVLKGIEAASLAGFQPIKINSVVQKGINDHTITDLAKYFINKGHIVRFIEYMDVGTLNNWNMKHVVPAKDIISKINETIPVKPIKAQYHGEVAKRYREINGPGEIGVITSVTNPFCGGCTRLRLSPEGSLYTCLFGTRGTDLRGPIRDGASDQELVEIISNTWRMRNDRYSETRNINADKTNDKKVEMYHIGG